MRCRLVKEKLAKYLAGECPLREERSIRNHLKNCADCANEKKSLEKLDNMLDTWVDEEMPPGLSENIISKVTQFSQTKTGK